MSLRRNFSVNRSQSRSQIKTNHRLRWWQRAAVVFVLLLNYSVCAESYQNHPRALEFIDAMVEQHGFTREELNQWFTQAERKQTILDAIAKPAEKTLQWKEYRNIFLVPSRIEKGVQFWRTHVDVLAAAEKQYGVPANVIVAVLGVETRYGEIKGNYRVMDALSTLAFDYPPRASFFRKELEHFLILAREQKQNPLDLLGSYAGAMGYGQFMPSSFRSYAVDFDGDEFKDIWNNPKDAIGSIANYLSRHGWKAGESIAVRARISDNYDASKIADKLEPQFDLNVVVAAGYEPVSEIDSADKLTVMRLQGENGVEFWLGLYNFYVITRYNRSALYAMAVYQLGQTIEQSLLAYASNE